MRVLFTFGFDPLNGSVVNEALLKQKSIKNVVRKLLHEVVKLSAVPIDPNLPPPVIKRPPPKVKQPPPPPKKRVGRDDIEMKKGDWLCPKYVSFKLLSVPWLGQLFCSEDQNIDSCAIFVKYEPGRAFFAALSM